MVKLSAMAIDARHPISLDLRYDILWGRNNSYIWLLDLVEGTE